MNDKIIILRKNSIRKNSHSLILLSGLCLAVWLRVGIQTAQAGEAAAPTSSLDSTGAESKLWSEITNAFKSATPPAHWKTNQPSQQEYSTFIVKAADREIAKLDKFLAEYPDGAHAGEARKLRSQMLRVAAMLGSKERAKELSQVAAESARDASLSPDERVEARLTKLRADSNLIADKADRRKAWVDGLIAIQRDFPKSDAIYRAMMAFLLTTEGGDAKRVAGVVMDSPDARPSFREQAREILGKADQRADPSAALERPPAAAVRETSENLNPRPKSGAPTDGATR